MSQPRTGSCLCKSLRYEISPSAVPIYNVVCHCINCRKKSGSHFACASIYLKSDFTITAGSPKLYLDKQTDSGKDLSRHFCDNCGSSVYVTTPLNEQIVSVPVGTLDGSEAEWVPNKEQYFDSKAHWVPDLELLSKEGVPDRHSRGPASAPPLPKI